jgi:NAD-dependent DNA ligase
MVDSVPTVKSCLAAINLEFSVLSGCCNLLDEFQAIKKAYFKKILVVHPDKGGDPEAFRLANKCFEHLRTMFESKKISSFKKAASKNEKIHNVTRKEAEGRSWEYYAHAASEEVPLYRVELAKSGRSKCNMAKMKTKAQPTKCQNEMPNIPKNSIRVGSMDLEAGMYGRWSHLTCWRVPSAIWLGLPDPEVCADPAAFEASLSSMNEVLFCGFSDLIAEDKALIVAYVMNKKHWARLTKRKASPTNETEDPSHDDTLLPSLKSEPHVKTESTKVELVVSSTQSSSSSSTTIVSSQKFFEMPIVGVTGIPNALAGKTIVLTGIFPEIGGGAGLNLGKDRLKHMCESFGARVTSAVSGRTDILIVGTAPGSTKVSKARAQPQCQLMTVHDLKLGVEGRQSLEGVPEPEITSFSSGYYGNGKHLLDSDTTSAQNRLVIKKKRKTR